MFGCMFTSMSTEDRAGGSWSLGQRSLAYDAGSAITGDDVVELQVLLDRLGYGLADETIYGPATADQVRQLQMHRGLVVDGVFGPLTFGELSGVLHRLSRPPGPHHLSDGRS